MWNDIYKPNSIGSEGGTIIVDEEYKESCRITLERCERLILRQKQKSGKDLLRNFLT